VSVVAALLARSQARWQPEKLLPRKIPSNPTHSVGVLPAPQQVKSVSMCARRHEDQKSLQLRI
jgi:hypothetical protein